MKFDNWMDHKGIFVLDERGYGFFLYEENGWVTIAEVNSSKSEKMFWTGTKISDETLARFNETRRQNKRIAFKHNKSFIANLILALNKIQDIIVQAEKPPETPTQAQEQTKDKEAPLADAQQVIDDTQTQKEKEELDELAEKIF